MYQRKGEHANGQSSPGAWPFPTGHGILYIKDQSVATYSSTSFQWRDRRDHMGTRSTGKLNHVPRLPER